VTEQRVALEGPVLVTGAQGFLGGYVMAEGRRRGLDVVDFGPARLPSSDVAARIHQVLPVGVIHLAGPSSVGASIQSPHEDFVGIVDGTACLLDALRKHAPGARVVLASSAAVYGEPASLPVNEGAPPRPLSPYGYHKLMAEMLVEEASRVRGTWAAVARIFSGYGPGLRRQVVFDLAVQALRGEDIVIDGTGDESRDFVHGRDVAGALVALLESAPGQAERYNVATGTESTIGDLAALVSRLSHGRPVHVTGHGRAGDPKRWCADVHALGALGFVPRTNLEDGVREILTWLANDATRGVQ
jgi:UDP-glucose 4-epimerase